MNMKYIHSKQKKQVKKMILKVEKIANFSFISEKNSKENESYIFSKNAKNIFANERFGFDNQFDHSGMIKFLKEKEECMKEMDLDESIDKNKRRKSNYTSIVYIKEKTETRKHSNNRRSKRSRRSRNTLFSSSSKSLTELIKSINDIL